MFQSLWSDLKDGDAFREQVESIGKKPGVNVVCALSDSKATRKTTDPTYKSNRR